jgi:hypothetical protein
MSTQAAIAMDANVSHDDRCGEGRSTGLTAHGRG